MKKEERLQLNSQNSAIMYIGGLVIAFILTFLTEFMPDGDVKTWLTYLSTQIGFILAILIFYRFNVNDLIVAIPVKRKLSPLALFITIPITIGVFMQNTLLATGFVKLMSLIGVNTSVDLPEPNNAMNVILGLICVCIAPAIGEEFMFRGVLLSTYKKKGGAIGVALSALVFALGHFNLAQLVHQFILGAILAYIVLATDNLWYAVAVHLINNVAALFLCLIPGYNELAVFDGRSAAIMAIMFVVGVFILYPSLYALTKVVGRDELYERDRWFFPIFFHKRGEEGIWSAELKKEEGVPDVWLITFIVGLALIAVFAAVISAIGI